MKSDRPENREDCPLKIRISSDPNFFRRPLKRTVAVKSDLDKQMKSHESDGGREDVPKIIGKK